MRTVNFRDDVLWAAAYRIGIDPVTELLQDQADALASYTNAWVRRLWDAADYPEWTVIGKFAPQTAPGLEHIVGWNHFPVEFIPPPMGPSVPEAPAPGAVRKPLIGKVLKVYLVDPRTTWLPVEIPFRLEHVGIHCGFEHGPFVWIKFTSRCPQYTAKSWDTNVTYNLDGLTYSPISGECYKSKTSNNRGRNPSGAGIGPGPIPAPLVEETFGAPDNPGLAATTKILDVFATYSGGPLPDPPAAGSSATITVSDSGGTVLTVATFAATGAESLEEAFTDLRDQLDAGLAGFTVTINTTPLSIRLEDTSDFSVVATVTTALGLGFRLSVVQAQKYVEATPPVAGHGQQFRLSITEEQVVPGATYSLTFTTVDSVEHVSIYVALATDNAQQVLSGLIDGMITLQGADPFFTSVQSTLDTASPAATFTIEKTIGVVSLHAALAPPGSTYWELVPFPFALVDQVVRGICADWKKEQGQDDKAQPEEQAVVLERQVRVASQTTQQYDPLTDQQGPKTRYSVK